MEHLVRNNPEEIKQHEAATQTEMTETLAHNSPEGRPADPNLHGRELRRLIALVPLAVVVFAVLIWLLGADPKVAIATGAFGLIAFLVSPVVWSSVLRARERDEVDREASHHHPPPSR
ncbi:MAG: hypothetical protein L6Q35_09400 [Phycisphaerales bacterium]|nr:hypothetical protein [Phycisphaerales bacterium]